MIAAIVAVSPLASPAPAGASPRLWQPLIVKGAKLPELLGSKIDHLEVLAMHGGRLVPIPFQVDEVRPDGRFALPNGPRPVIDDSPGIVDRDDELVMMVSDLGARDEDPAALPKGLFELVVSDPLGGPDRYAYVGAVASPELSATDYVNYDPRAERVESDHYRLGLREGIPVDFALQSRKHDRAANMIRGFRVRVHALVLKLFDYNLTEHNLHTRLLAWKSGPVRVLREDSHSADVMLGIRSPEVTSEVLFYRDYIDNPVKVKLPWVPSLIFGNIRVRVYLDLFGSRDYRLAWSGLQSQPVSIAYGAPEPLGGDHASAPIVSWVSLISGERAMLQTVVPGADMMVVEKQLYYRDRAGADGREPMLRAVGARPHDFGLGYEMTGWDKLSSGSHYFDSLMISAGTDYSASLLLDELRSSPTVSLQPPRK